MNDIALILPSADTIRTPRAPARSALADWRAAVTYAAFALSVGFTLSMVLGVVN